MKTRYYFLAATSLLLATLGPLQGVAQIPTEGLVAYYPFNGNANDESGNGNDGTPVRAVLTADRFGQINSAFDFNGMDAYIDLGANQNLLITGDITISAWIKADNFDYYATIFGWGSYGDGEEANQVYHFHVLKGGSNNYLRHSHESGQGTNTDVISIRPLSTGVWIHAAMVRNSVSKTYRFYLDAVAETDISYTTNPTGGWDGTGFIGWSPTGTPGWGLDGIIDDVRMYDRALTDSEILELFNEGSSQGDEPVLVAYYPFNGNTNDESGNGNNGTIIGGVTPATDRFGNPNSAYHFNGTNGYISIPNSASLQSADSAVTVTAWANVEAWDNTWAAVVAKSNTSSRAQYGLAFSSQTGGRVDVDISNTYVVTYVGSDFQLAHWYFVCFTWNGATLNVYVDGTLMVSTPYSVPPHVDSFPLEIGRHTPTNTEYMNGRLDDIRIYDGALTSDEMGTLYHEGGWPPSHGGLVAYYPFNGNADDESGNGNDGVAQGATLVDDRFGTPNSAYAFDGINDFIAIGSNPSLLITCDMSISAWVNMASVPSWFVPVIPRGEWGETEDVNVVFDLHVLNSSGAIYSRHSHEHGNGVNTDVMSTRPLSTERWIHLGIVRHTGQKTYRFYVNGVPEAEIPYEHNPTGGWNTAGYIGWAPWGVTTYFNGSIDDIKILTRAISDSEMMAYYSENGWLATSQDVAVDIPEEFGLEQNYPNPFNPSTTIRFSLPQTERVRLTIYDVLGQEVGQPIDETMEPGVHAVRYDAYGLASGTYVYRIEAGGFVASKKFLLIR